MTETGRVPPSEDGTVNVFAFQRHGPLETEPVTLAAWGSACGKATTVVLPYPLSL